MSRQILLISVANVHLSSCKGAYGGNLPIQGSFHQPLISHSRLATSKLTSTSPSKRKSGNKLLSQRQHKKTRQSSIDTSTNSDFIGPTRPQLKNLPTSTDAIGERSRSHKKRDRKRPETEAGEKNTNE